MILVTLGTQDKSFERLVKAIDKEIENGNIKDKVIVQAGYTKYKSDNMEIFDFVLPDKLDKLMKEADILITHGGVGSILGALKYDKPVIAAARLSKYKEHTNDHQKQIVDEFYNTGYILKCNNPKDLEKVLVDKNAKILSSKEMGQKELAYEIKKHKSGYYFLINVEANNKTIDEFNRLATISEDIIRHLIVRL